jgi:hypothetical protein
MANISNIPPGKTTRVAGLTYILIIIVGVLKVNFIEPSVIVKEGYGLVNNILANEFLFRIGIACETIMYILVIVLSLALYIILKPIDKNLALSALFLRFGEAIIGVTLTIISGLIPLLMLNADSVIEKEQMQALIELFLNVRIVGLNIVLIFIGLGGTVFCYLFYRSWLVPRMLAVWGIFTYISMLMLGLISILFPNRPDMIETVLFSLGALFEVIFGFWLLLKGVNTDKWRSLAIETAE